MKLSSSTTTTLFTLFLLSAAITTSHLPSAAADFIFDQDGEPLRNGGEYYVLPVIRGAGGGVTLGKTGNEGCPVSVVQSPFETSRGLPVRFSSPAKIAYIYDGLFLSLAFNAAPDCAPTSSWKVVKGSPEGLSIKLSGSDDSVDGSFNIASHGRQGHDYTIKFCSASSNDECGDIAVDVDENGVRNLVVIDDKSKDNSPFIVRFRRARRHHHAFADDA